MEKAVSAEEQVSQEEKRKLVFRRSGKAVHGKELNFADSF